MSSKAIQPNLYLSATQTTGHAGREGTRGLVAQVDGLQLDVVTIVNVGDVDTHLITLFCFYTFREGHRLGLYLTVWVKLGNGLDALIGRHDGGEAAVGIVLELLDGHAATKAATTRQLACMIEEIAMPFEVGYTTVVGK